MPQLAKDVGVARVSWRLSADLWLPASSSFWEKTNLNHDEISIVTMQLALVLVGTLAPGTSAWREGLCLTVPMAHGRAQWS